MTIKYIARVAGVLTSISAAILGGAGAASSIVATNAQGLIDPSFFPAGIGPDQVTAPASEAIGAGNLVNLWNNAGAVALRNADSATASAGKKADYYAPAAIASGATGTVYRGGQQGGYASLTPGNVWLGTAGATTQTPPAETAGTTAQLVGTAISATSIDFLMGTAIAIGA